MTFQFMCISWQVDKDHVLDCETTEFNSSLCMLCLEWRVQKWRRDTVQREHQAPSFSMIPAFEVLLASAQGEEKRQIRSTWNSGGSNSEGISWCCSWISAGLCKCWGLIRKACETAEFGSFRRCSWVDSGDSGSGESCWYLVAGVTQMWNRTARGDFVTVVAPALFRPKSWVVKRVGDHDGSLFSQSGRIILVFIYIYIYNL